MHVRRLNSTGLAKFKAFLEASRSSDSPSETFTEILASRSTWTGLNVAIEIEPISGVSSKSELAGYLHEILRPLDRGAGFSRNGMWSWAGAVHVRCTLPGQHTHRSADHTERLVLHLSTRRCSP